MRRGTGWAVAAAASAGGAWFALHGVSWGAVREALSAVEAPGRLALVPVAAGLEYALRTIRWRVLLDLPAVPLSRLFPTVSAAFFLNSVLPFRAGEAARVYWTARRTGRGWPSCASALALDRLFDLGGVLLLFLVALGGGAGSAIAGRSLGWALGALLAPVAALTLAAIFPGPARSALLRPWVPGPLRRIVGGFLDGIGVLRRPRRVLAAFVCTAGIWGLVLVIFRTAAGVFGLSLGTAGSAWLVTGMALGVALPSTPGYVGTYEAAGVAALELLGVAKARALPFIVSVHVGQILGTVIWGAPGLLLLHREGRTTGAQSSPELLKSEPR